MQGSVLSVTLFAIAINEITKQLWSEVHGTLYVDAFTIFVSAATIAHSTRIIQIAINNPEQWTKTKGMRFSIEKPVAIKFEKRKKGEEPQLTLHGSIVQVREGTRYLGLIMDKRLNWKDHVDHLRAKCTSSVNLIKHVSHLSWGSDRKTLKRLYTDELAPVLCRLFRPILISCTSPSSWKHALVQPVPKKSDRSNPSNYRPIALTSAVAKVFENLFNFHFIKHLESNNLLSDHQYGFRKARSTGDLLSYLTHVWSSSLRNFGESFVVALDISKAFDRVWHKALLAKLPAYSFTPSFCKLISIFLSNRFIYVVVDGATFASFPVSSGVPQGSVLSPTLFLLFINDLLHATASDVHSFANDSNLHKSSSFQCQPSSNARSQSRLAMSSTINSDLQSISEWGTRNLVKFNTSKTQLLTISLSNTPSNYPIIFEDSKIPPLNSINILDLQISSSLSWRDHIVQIAKSASKKLGVLFRCKQYFNGAQLFKLYTGFIRPCLEYCSYIWGSSPYTSLLDRIESKAIRLIGDPSLTSTLDPLSLRRKVASLSLFYRYYFGHCSDELAACIPPPMAWPRSTRQATFAHNYCVELSNARINQFSDGFFPSTSHLWNSLPSSVFPASFNLPSFKRQVYRHLRDQMA